MNTYTYTYSGNIDNSTLALILGLLGAYSVVAIVWYIVVAVANWRVFTKAGEAGWKSLIPFYNDYTAFKLFWKPLYFWLGLVLSVAGSALNSIVGSLDQSTQGGLYMTLGLLGIVCMGAVGVFWIIRMHKTSVSFGHGIGFTLGLIFINPIFLLILAFGSSTYRGTPENQ